MFAHFVSALAIASTLVGQTPLPDAQAAMGQQAQPPASQAITLPAGTSIAITLMNPIRSKSTKPGDAVRAVVAFPVTVGNQLAIPAGAYAEGVISQVTSRPMSNQQPSFRVHFTRLVFANGYSVPLSGENTQALALPLTDANANVEVAELTPFPAPIGRFAMGDGQMPTLQPPPRLGPNPAVIGGIIAGIMAASLIGTLAWMHHRANTYDYVLFDAGWQFQMVLDSPVTLDVAQVAAAATAQTAN